MISVQGCSPHAFSKILNTRLLIHFDLQKHAQPSTYLFYQLNLPQDVLVRNRFTTMFIFSGPYDIKCPVE